ILITHSHMTRRLFHRLPRFERHIFVAMPNLPIDYKTDGLQHYERLQQTHQLTANYRNNQLLALASAKLLKQGLIKTGREMQQQKLVAMVEALYKFDTQLTRLITYGPNRRLGTSGAYIVTLDLVNKTILPVSDWLEVQ
ncbi:MAG: hypothetical protein HRT35_36180, partial [Algicola sp.]|nr:hypothetical protein [Algicola sp.]